MVSSLQELHSMGKPENNEELKERIDQYFAFCQSVGFRPGVESLSLALHISRITLFNWANGDGCDKERQEIILSAKAFIAAFLEQSLLAGKISPPSGIFLMKNWLSYSDTISLENRTCEDQTPRALPASELPKLGLMTGMNQNRSELPNLTEKTEY